MLIHVRLINSEVHGWGVMTFTDARTAFTFCQDREAAVHLKREAEKNTVTREFLHGVRDER